MPAATLLVNVGMLGLRGFLGGSRLALNAVTGLASAMGTLASVLSTVAISFSAVTAVIGAFILIQTRAIDTIGKTSTKLGVATDFLQKFRFAAEQSGVDITTSDLALQRFVRRLGEAQKGTGELLPALRRLGIDTKNTDGSFKSAEQVLKEFADGLQNTRNDTTQLALAFKAFDSEGAALVALLEQGSDALEDFYNEAEKLGFILDEDIIKNVELAADNFNRFTNVIQGFMMQVVGALAPAINQISDDLLALADKASGGETSFRAIGEYLKNEFFNILIKVVDFLDLVRIQFAKLANFVTTALYNFGFFNGTLERTNEILDQMAKANFLPTSLNQFLETIPMYAELIAILTAAGVEIDGLAESMQNLNNLLAGPGQGGDVGDAIKFVENLQKIAKQAVEEGKIANDKPLLADLLFDTDPSKLAQRIKDYLAGLRDLPQDITNEIIDDNTIEEVVVKGVNKIGQTLLGKIFGVERVKDFWDEWYSVGEDAIGKLNTIAKLVLGDNVFEGLRESLSQAGFGDFEKTLIDGLTKAGMAFEDALVDAFKTGELSLKKFGDLLKDTLLRAFIQKTITGPIGDLFGLAKGGPARAGQPYIIGEEGPEIFVPNQSGTVIPNDAINTGSGSAISGTTNVYYTINATDPESFRSQLSRDPEFIYNLTRVGARRTPG